MAFQIPSIANIWTRTRDAFRAYLPGTDAWIEPNNLSVSGKVFSLNLFEAYQRVLYLYKQMFATTADTYHLENRHGYEYGIQRKASISATGHVTISQAFVEANVVIPAGVRLVRGDGVTYLTTASGVMSSGSTTVPVRAEQAGANTNASEGSALTVERVSGLPNLVDGATVATGGIGGGADEETDDQLRARILYRKRNPPHGGAASDYVIWATEVPGCTRAFVSPFTNSPGAVTLYPLFDDTRPDGIPTTADVAAVSDHIGAESVEGVRPVTARIYVVAPIANPIDVTIHNLQTDTTSTRAAIAEQLAAMFDERAVVSTAAEPFTLPLSWISEAISRATGENRHTLAAPAADVSISTGRLPTLGTITFA